MSNSSPLISAQQLTCIREERILFEQLSFDIFAGDIVQIEGPNGAGKTSLLRLLAGLSMPFEGEVQYLSKPIKQQQENYFSDLLYLGHTPGVKAELTAQENLAFNLAVQGLDAAQAESTLEQVNLLGFEDALASHLSAGQHRRIALARLWHTESKVWILDEPFTAIDKSGVRNLEQRFVNHANNGGCIILTTHQDLSLPKNQLKKITLDYRLF